MILYKQLFVFLGASFFMLNFAACGGAKPDDTYKIEENPPFVLGDVFYQDWVAGVKDGGSGTNVHLTFQSFTDDVVIQEVFFRRKITKAQIAPEKRNKYIGYFRNDDRVDVVMNSDPIKEAQNKPPRKFPFELLENEVVVSYLQNDLVKFAKISNLRREEMLAYPSTKPKDDN